MDDLVPGYCSLLVLYDPLRADYQTLVSELKRLSVSLQEAELPPQRHVEVPVCYGGQHGPDLTDVAVLHKLSEAEVIRQHSSKDYLVYFIGFCPGFPYMGEVPSSIATPRLPRPRVRVTAGSVGIAGNQTGIYPIETPGGWRLIGQTPLKLFDPSHEPPNLLWAGDSVRFIPISPSEFNAIESEAAGGRYDMKVTLENIS